VWDENPTLAVSIEIRRMVAADVATAAGLLRESQGAARWTEDALRKALIADSTVAFVSELNGEITGVIVGGRIVDEAEILNLAVKKEFRRKGLARALVQRVMAEWNTSKVANIFLEVRESNDAAIRMYEGFGFQRAGRRIRYYTEPEEDALVLKWSPPSR
jgi:[ribosomal protein S18]-alanine N-acetyltransferase